MARTNHQFGKRQRELAKKQKREEKLQRRAERKLNPTDEFGQVIPDPDAEDENDDESEETESLDTAGASVPAEAV